MPFRRPARKAELAGSSLTRAFSDLAALARSFFYAKYLTARYPKT